MIKKSAISLISYDADYLPQSIKKYYDYVDEIVLGLDKDRITWSGNTFSFDENKLWSELQQIDGDNKISVIEEDFHNSKVAIENDNFERNFLKGECTNDWIISIDADEVLLNASSFFREFCPLVERYYTNYDVCMTWATPYKKLDNGEVLVIAEEDTTPFFGENQGIMTSKDSTFTYARWTNKSAAGQNRLRSPLVALHWSLCRSDKDLHMKINNIGHSDIVEKDPFYSVWKQVNESNYQQLRNFKTSGLGGAQWPKLFSIPEEQLEGYITANIKRAY